MDYSNRITDNSLFRFLIAYTREHSQASDEQIEVLKQQISVYVEDFNSERQEKEKLLEEVKKMKVRVREAEMEAADCRKQVNLMFIFGPNFLISENSVSLF